MAYGSWSGGIYVLELDEETGLRDYTVTYESDIDTQGKNFPFGKTGWSIYGYNRSGCCFFSEFHLNYTADWGMIKDFRGERLMTNYQWNTMEKGEVSQGHNSAIVDENGRAYVVYHTKFNDGTVAHELRVHELFTNENGWLVASPFEFTNDEALSLTEAYSVNDIAGRCAYV